MFPGPDWFRGWPALFCWSWGPSAVLASLLAALSPHQDSVQWLEEAPPARGPPEAALWTRTPPLPGAAPLPGRLVSECGSTEDPGWREHRRPWLLAGKYLVPKWKCDYFTGPENYLYKTTSPLWLSSLSHIFVWLCSYLSLSEVRQQKHFVAQMEDSAGWPWRFGCCIICFTQYQGNESAYFILFYFVSCRAAFQFT